MPTILASKLLSLLERLRLEGSLKWALEVVEMKVVNLMIM